MPETKETTLKDEKLFDLSMIVQMCRGKEEQIKKMLTVFINQTPETIAIIKRSFHEKDFDLLKNTVHRIKPTLTYYGIHQLIDEMNEVEQMAERSLNTHELELKINHLELVLTLVVEKMKKDFFYTDKI
jgi:HPt (histidine-containing phosphotransfer) domain-containing protein